MVSKTISVTEEVYELLRRARLPHESFGDAIARLCNSYSTKNLLKWLNSNAAWEDMSEEVFLDVEKSISQIQGKYNIETVDF